jgi:hypothetical protein
MATRKFMGEKIFFLVTLIGVMYLIAPITFALLSCSLELSKDNYDPEEDLVAMVSISSEDFVNSSTLGVVLSYAIMPEGSESPIIEKTQTLSLQGERTIILKQPLNEDFHPGTYIFKADVESKGEKYPLQKNFEVKGSGSSSIIPIIAVIVLVAMTAAVFLKRRGN